MELNSNLTKLEPHLNVSGSIPIIAIVSGAVRFIAGAIQAFVGMVFATIGLIGMFTNPKNHKWEQMAESGFEHFGHGGMNALRGFGEHVLGLTIIGSVALFVCQYASPNKFQPIIKYQPSPSQNPTLESRSI